MIRPLPEEVADVLAGGVLCHVAARTVHGPHLTPVVFALHASRLWITTSRRAVKARAWRADPRVGGMVRAGSLAVSFSGSVRMYDFLQPDTWTRSVINAPTLTRAAIAFSRKNARFFAGYAVDAYQVPFAWTPPARVFVELRLDRVVLLDEERGDVLGRWGTTVSPPGSHSTFRASADKTDPLAQIPEDVRSTLAAPGPAALGLDGARGPMVLPARWAMHRGGMYAASPASFLQFAEATQEMKAALTIDRASRWRASAMSGVLVQGRADLYEVDGLRSGGTSAAGALRATGLTESAAALVRIRPSRVVWWQGWRSGTVAAG